MSTLKKNLQSLNIDETTLNTLIEITPGAVEYKDDIIEFLGAIPNEDLAECREKSGAPLVEVLNKLFES